MDSSFSAVGVKINTTFLDHYSSKYITNIKIIFIFGLVIFLKALTFEEI